MAKAYTANDTTPRRPYMIQTAEPYIDKEGKMVRPLVPMFPCQYEGCTADGTFGFGVNLRRKKPGMWFCGPHRVEGEAIFNILQAGRL